MCSFLKASYEASTPIIVPSVAPLPITPNPPSQCIFAVFFPADPTHLANVFVNYTKERYGVLLITVFNKLCDLPSLLSGQVCCDVFPLVFFLFPLTAFFFAGPSCIKRSINSSDVSTSPSTLIFKLFLLPFLGTSSVMCITPVKYFVR